MDGGGENYKVHLQSLTEKPGLNEVDPPFAALALAYEGLCCPQSRCKLFLGDPLGHACLSQLTEECQVSF